MEEYPKIPLDKALDHLRPNSNFQTVLEEIQGLLDDQVTELPHIPIEQTDRCIGAIAAYQSILSILRGS